MCDNVCYHPTVLGFLKLFLNPLVKKKKKKKLAKFQSPQQFSLNSIRSSEELLGYGKEMLGVKVDIQRSLLIKGSVTSRFCNCGNMLIGLKHMWESSSSTSTWLLSSIMITHHLATAVVVVSDFLILCIKATAKLGFTLKIFLFQFVNSSFPLLTPGASQIS